MLFFHSFIHSAVVSPAHVHRHFIKHFISDGPVTVSVVHINSSTANVSAWICFTLCSHCSVYTIMNYYASLHNWYHKGSVTKPWYESSHILINATLPIHLDNSKPLSHLSLMHISNFIPALTWPSTCQYNYTYAELLYISDHLRSVNSCIVSIGINCIESPKSLQRSHCVG